jgi:hypothetical protein
MDEIGFATITLYPLVKFLPAVAAAPFGLEGLRTEGFVFSKRNG